MVLYILKSIPLNTRFLKLLPFVLMTFPILPTCCNPQTSVCLHRLFFSGVHLVNASFFSLSCSTNFIVPLLL